MCTRDDLPGGGGDMGEHTIVKLDLIKCIGQQKGPIAIE